MHNIVSRVSCSFAMLSILVSPALFGSSGDPACALSGFVVDAVSGESLSNATLELEALAKPQSMRLADLYPGAPVALGGIRYTALSGGGGRFCFAALPQGQYVLWARREGFLESHYGTTSPGQMSQVLDIGPQQEAPVTVRMWPEATMSGVISDSQGRPVTAGLVEVVGTVWFRGRPHTVVVKGAQVTGVGEYKIVGIPPGKYYVRFRPLDSAQLCGGCLPAQQTTREFVPTFYPSGLTTRDAVAIEVGLGDRVSKLHIVARQGAKFTVSGRMRISGTVPEFASLWLLAQDEEPTAWVLGSSVADREGGFRFLNVAPGTYGLHYFMGGTSGISVGRVETAVRDGDVTVDIDGPPPLRLSGKVTVDGVAGAKLKGMKVALVPADRIMDPSCSGEVQENGEVVLEGCSVGRYTLAVSTGRVHYVKQILYAGADITNGVLTGRHNGAELRIALREGAARIRGTLSPAKSAWYVVVPVELPAQVLPVQARLGYSDGTGTFLVEGLPPGRFAVVGLAAPDLSALHNPDALLALAALGTEVQLRENEEAVITAPLISALEGQRALRLAGVGSLTAHGSSFNGSRMRFHD
ncbi:MAG TPA: carboxypeptidase-like regulatory domain-containing protein [Bryobacteraceae bacterium]|nr:carboxypeptidase-like regulatory domain-containing protein [Bryobacteraceae bacterium]